MILKFAISTDRQKPFLLWLAPWVLMPLGLVTLAFSGVMLLERDAGGVGFAPGNLHAEALSILSGVIVSLIFVGGGYGLYKDRLWARWLLTAGWFLLLLLGALAALVITSPTVAFPVFWGAVETLPFADADVELVVRPAACPWGVRLPPVHRCLPVR